MIFQLKKYTATIGPLRIGYLERANVSLTKNIQNKYFFKEIKDLTEKHFKKFSFKSKLY